MSVVSEIMRIGRLPKQALFIDENEHRYDIFSGSRAAGKTYGLGVKTAKRACVPGAREGLFRMNYSDLVNTTLVTLLEGDDLPPILPPGSYRHDQQKHRIDIHGGGRIVYGGFDKGLSAKEMGGTGGKSSMNLSGASIDEGVEVPESLLVQLDGAVRMKVPGLCNQINIACNPGPPTHYLARRFGLSLDHEIMARHWAIRTNIYDNFMLDREFVEAFAQSLSGVAFKRYVWGLWVGSDGLVYDMFNRDFHAITPDEYDPENTSARVYALDPGTNDPMALLQIDKWGDDLVHVPREFYESGHSFGDHVELCREFMGDEAETAELVVDSQYKGMIMDLRRAGINAIGCKKGKDSIMRGVGVVSARLKRRTNGMPGLTMNPACVKTLAEFESYEYDKNAAGYKDKPKDQNNHSMDALRYGVERLDRGGSAYVSDAIELKNQAMPPGGVKDMDAFMELLEEAAEEQGIDMDEFRKNNPQFGLEQ